MHVLVVSPFYELNSSISRPSFVARVLNEDGVDTTILTSDFSHPLKMYRIIENTIQLKTIFYKNNTSFLRLLSHTVLSIKFAFWVVKNRRRYDKVYVTVPFGLTAFIVSMFIKNKLIVDVVDFWPGSLPFPKIFKILCFPIFLVWKFINRLAVKRAYKVISLSSRFLDDAGVSRSGIQIYLGAKKAKNLAKIDDHHILRVLYIGNLGLLYDFYTLVESFMLCEFKCHFEIIGVGDKLEDISKLLVDNNISHEINGPVYDEKEIAKVVARSDIAFNGFVDTTASLSYKSVLYFSHGLPIINSMKGDLWDIVDEYNVGFNYKAGDKFSLLNALNQFWQLKQSNIGGCSNKTNVDDLFQNNFEYHKVSKQISRIFHD